ncbi:MAG: tRNA pseudouridine synthase A [Deltaproteobacteria bacterium]|nr:tRNA pseudouridine synthase A [Deltaproteobacteria bacterium]
MNYLFVLEYNGLNYNGWQNQNNPKNPNAVKTIENELLKAIRIATKFNPKLFVSGRTDAGVHALNQVANCQLPFYYDTARLKVSLNGILPADISIKNIEIVHDSFHSTFDTISKTYLYKINSEFRSPLLFGYSWFVKERLNLVLMKEVANIFTGRNNFINFAKKEKGRHPFDYYRMISDIGIYQKDYGFDIFVEGEGFLRHMVRRIAGAIVACGSGKVNTEYIITLMLSGKSLASKALNAPPWGLFLYSVRYEHKNYC